MSKQRRPKASDYDRAPEIKYLEFNPVRCGRGKEAAKFNVNGNLLWMSEKDVDRNLELFDNHPELLKAKLAYKLAPPPSFVPPSDPRIPSPVERQELAAFIAEQTGQPCEPDDILSVRRARPESEADK